MTPSVSGILEEAGPADDDAAKVASAPEEAEKGSEPPKKKRRVALTRVGEVGS